MHPPETRRRALEMVEAGDSLRSISLALGVSRAAIREWVARGPSSLEAGCPLPLAPARYDAYSALLGYYLGDGCLGRNRRTRSLRVGCDETYPGIVEDVASCMRAFHSDGARVRNWVTRLVGGEVKRYEYLRRQFVNRSEQILGWRRQTLDLAGVPWRRSNTWTVSVSRRDGVARLDRLIGPKY